MLHRQIDRQTKSRYNMPQDFTQGAEKYDCMTATSHYSVQGTNMSPGVVLIAKYDCQNV